MSLAFRKLTDRLGEWKQRFCQCFAIISLFNIHGQLCTHKVPVTPGLGSLKTTLRSAYDQLSAQGRPIRLCGSRSLLARMSPLLIISNRCDSTILSNPTIWLQIKSCSLIKDTQAEPSMNIINIVTLVC